MKHTDLTKGELSEKIRVLQQRINSLEKTAADFSQVKDTLCESEKNLSAILENNADGIVIIDADGIVLYTNPAAEKLFNISKKEFLGYPFGFPISSNEREVSLVIRKGDMFHEVEVRVVHIQWQKQPALQLSLRDVTERKQAEEELKKIEWLLEKEKSLKEVKNYIPDYGDVTKLNTERTILDHVGTDTLKTLCSDIMDLLDTSIAIYEKNGDYAFGQFDSRWCQTMDIASFHLCKTQDSKQALNCGKWLCHENCWNDSAKDAMITEKTTDIDCVGEICLYGVPIFAGGEIIGAINMGYGNPPTDEKTLKELAEKFKLDCDILTKNSNLYKVRPPVIIENAKKRLHTVAQLIGKIVENAQKERQIKISETSLRDAQRIANIGSWSLDMQTGRVEMSDEMLNIIGLKDKNEAMDVSSHEKFYTPESWKRFNEAVEEVLTTGKSYEIVLEFSDKKAKFRYAIARGEAINDENNKIIGLEGTLQDITNRKIMEEALREKSFNLTERVKELNCLYEISNLLQIPDISDDDFFQGVVDLIPPAFRHSKTTACCLIINEKEYKTRNFKKTDWNICKDIIVDKRISGSIEVCQLEKLPDQYSGQFLAEERNLINAISERLGHIIERNKREEELIESEQKIRSIMENSADAIFITDKKGQYIYTNKAVTAMLGFTKKEMKGKSIIDMAPQNRINEYLEVFNRLNTEKKIYTEIELLTKDGTYIPADLNAIILPDGNVYGSSRDLTERKLADQALIESERKYRALYNSIRDAILVANTDRKIIDCNQAFSNLFEYSFKEIKNKYTYSIYENREQFDELGRELKKHSGETTPFLYTVNYKKKSGVVFPGETSIYYLYDDSGKITGFIGMIRDVTIRLQAEKEIENIAKFPSENPNPVMRIAKDGTILYVNKAGQKSLESWQDKEGRILPGKPMELIEEALQINKPINSDFECCDKIFTLTFMPFPNTNYVNIYGLDITDQKRIEAERLKLEDKFRESQKLESIGTLAGGIAHDFNNLLTIIMGHAQIAMMTASKDGHLYKGLTQIVTASTRAANLTRQLLMFSRKQEIDLKTLEVNVTIRNLLKMIQRLIAENISVETNLEDGLANIEADEGNIEQVIMNLAVNARDAMLNGGNLTITTENVRISEAECKILPESRPGEFVRISVEDTGDGIPKKVLNKIFEPFFTTKAKGQGTGLGLSVVHGIVKSHKGWINIYSEVGQGTVFKIYLPVSTSIFRKENMTNLELKISMNGNGENILIIEDDKNILKLISSTLRQYGYIVHIAANGDEALALFKEAQGNFQLIISDVILPDINGYDLVCQITKDHPEIPVVMCSGYTEERVKQSTIKKKGFQFLQKPFSMNELLETVKNAILKNSGKTDNQAR